MPYAVVQWTLVTGLLCTSCKQHEPVQWLGMDRSTVSCGYEGPSHDNLTCIGTGHVYRCVTDDWRTWRCAEVRRVESDR